MSLKAKAKIVDHSVVVGESRGHTLLFDAPSARGGQDKGIEQPEGMLASLAACYLEWVRKHAKRFGINLIEVEVECEGDLAISRDMKWKLGQRTGFTNIRTNYKIKADNSDEEIQEFVNLMNELCIVGNTLLYPPELTHSIEVLKD